jgi:hypothetical protein
MGEREGGGTNQWTAGVQALATRAGANPSIALVQPRATITHELVAGVSCIRVRALALVGGEADLGAHTSVRASWTAYSYESG